METKRRNVAQGLTAARMVDPHTRAIVAAGYPDEELTAQQLALLNDSVEEAVSKIESGPLPSFDDVFIKAGAIMVVAKDGFSRDWLGEILPKLKPWEEARLSMVEMSALKKPYRTTVRIPGPRIEPAVVLARIERRHPNLSVERWRVVAEERREGPDSGTFLVLNLPESAVKELRKLNFQLQWGLGRITLRVEGGSREQGPENAAGSAETH